MGTDEIVQSVWEIPDGITKDTDSFADTFTTVWLSGGVLGKTYKLLNRVTTAGGRVMDQTVVLPMGSR